MLRLESRDAFDVELLGLELLELIGEEVEATRALLFGGAQERISRASRPARATSSETCSRVAVSPAKASRAVP